MNMKRMRMSIDHCGGEIICIFSLYSSAAFAQFEVAWIAIKTDSPWYTDIEVFEKLIGGIGWVVARVMFKKWRPCPVAGLFGGERYHNFDHTLQVGGLFELTNLAHSNQHSFKTCFCILKSI